MIKFILDSKRIILPEYFQGGELNSSCWAQ